MKRCEPVRFWTARASERLRLVCRFEPHHGREAQQYARQPSALKSAAKRATVSRSSAPSSLLSAETICLNPRGPARCFIERRAPRAVLAFRLPFRRDRPKPTHRCRITCWHVVPIVPRGVRVRSGRHRREVEPRHVSARRASRPRGSRSRTAFIRRRRDGGSSSSSGPTTRGGSSAFTAALSRLAASSPTGRYRRGSLDVTCYRSMCYLTRMARWSSRTRLRMPSAPRRRRLAAVWSEELLKDRPEVNRPGNRRGVLCGPSAGGSS